MKMIETSLKYLFSEPTFLAPLGIDPDHSPALRRVRGYFYTHTPPHSSSSTRLIALSPPLLQQLGLKEQSILQDTDSAAFLSGSKAIDNCSHLCHVYCGYQFGVWASQLGDGRACTLGHGRDLKGQLLEFQTKGSGKTPFSRMADGRAVLRSSIRQFLASQFMHHLDIPTTRALSIVTIKQKVMRDPLYDGRAMTQPCAVVMRVSPSFIRFGSFEVCNPGKDGNQPGPSHGLQKEMIPKLSDFVIKHFYTSINMESSTRYEDWFTEIVRRTAQLVAKWQVYGFVHGVLNTDNMSILGLTIDYGPYAFMDRFEPKLVSNHSDKQARYCYHNQPTICHFNLQRLSQALLTILPAEKSAPILSTFHKSYEEEYHRCGSVRLGLIASKEESKALVEKFFSAMEKTGSRMNQSFLAVQQFHQDNDAEKLIGRLVELSASRTWMENIKRPVNGADILAKVKHLVSFDPVVAKRMGISPQLVQTLEKQHADYDNWLAAKYDPLSVWKDFTQQFVKKAPRTHNLDGMRRANPRHNLCNYVLQNCIELESRGVGATDRMMKALIGMEDWDESWEKGREKKICISCSS